MTEDTRRAGRATQSGSTRTILLTLGGVAAATAPAWLFAIAAGAFGPRTATLAFALPVLASTALAIWASLALRRRGSRGAALTVGIVALVIGVLMYVAWAYLAGLGIRFGDGPL